MLFSCKYENFDLKNTILWGVGLGWGGWRLRETNLPCGQVNLMIKLTFVGICSNYFDVARYNFLFIVTSHDEGPTWNWKM